MCRELYDHRDWLWTFADHEGIEPTNNTAERALRPAVIYRKLSFGTQSESGSRFIERMLTISETCRLQKRGIYQWLCDAVDASLVEWLLRKDNPYFARAFVNRVWARYFGSGIVDPPDDFNMGNPPRNAALLDWLASEFIEQGFDMKWLHRTIAGSRTYQLGSETNETNAADTRHFSHARLRRLQAEVIVDSIVQATANDGANRNCLDYMPRRRIAKHPGNLTPRANEYALMVFGKPTRSTTATANAAHSRRCCSHSTLATMLSCWNTSNARTVGSLRSRAL